MQEALSQNKEVQPGLQSEFQDDSQGYTEKPCLKTKQASKQTKTNKQKTQKNKKTKTFFLKGPKPESPTFLELPASGRQTTWMSGHPRDLGHPS